MTNTSQTVFLVGTGVEKGAWPPIARAIKDVSATAQIDPNSNRVADESAFWLAQHVLQFRLLYSPDFAARLAAQELQNAQKEHARLDAALKQAIARHLDDAVKSGELKLRDRFRATFNDYAAWGPTIVFTSNWDRLLEVHRPDGSPTESFLRIHGDTEDPATMLLPSEISGEPWRTQEHREHKGQVLGTIWQRIGDANFLCIYGLSLDPLDAELAYMVRMGISEAKSLQEIIVFNLPQERERLLGRVRMLADGRNVPIRFVDTSKPRPPGSGRF